MTVLDGYEIAWLVGQAFEPNSQQFRDVVGVLQFQGNALNQHYLDVWARRLGLEELLKRAREAAAA